MTEKIKRFIDCIVPINTCNLRCHYCYVTQNREFDKELPKFKYTSDLKFYQKIYKKVKVFDILDRCNKEYTWFFGFKFKKHHKGIDIIRRLNFIEDEIRKMRNKD